jgi:hypothetical protein
VLGICRVRDRMQADIVGTNILVEDTGGSRTRRILPAT